MEKIKTKALEIEWKIKTKILKQENLKYLFIIIVMILSEAIRYVMLQYESPDYINFLQHWFNEIKELGGIKALQYNIGDYNIPYLTILAILSYIPLSPLILIKLVSIIFDFIGALYAAKLVKAYIGDNKRAELIPYIVFAVILFLPTVLINSSLWAQCDMIYVTFILMSLYYLKKGKTIISFICLGMSFAFKLQFIFILPVYVLLYFQKKNISIFHFLIIPLVNLILCIPSIMMGKSLKDCIMIYFNQTGTYTQLTLKYPNLYNIFVEFFEHQTIVLVILTIVIIGIISFYLLYKKVDIEANMLKLALLFSMLMVFFLPRMHERYGFLAEILAILYVAKYKKAYYLPIVLQLATLCGYFTFLAHGSFNSNMLILFSLIQFIAIAKYTIDTLKDVEMQNNERRLAK